MASKITTEEFAVLFAEYSLISRSTNRHLAHACELSLAQYYVLLMLSKNDHLRMGDISRLMSISRPNLTPIVDCLVEAGCVRRQPHHEDRRVTYITLTDTGRETLQRENASLCCLLEKHLALLCDEEFDELCGAISTIVDVFERNALTEKIAGIQ